MIDDAASDQSNQPFIKRLHQASCFREVNHDVHGVDDLVGHQVCSVGIFRDFIVDEMIARSQKSSFEVLVFEFLIVVEKCSITNGFDP
jgi:hypothetical protein